MIQRLDEICFGCFISFTEVPQVDQKSQKYIVTLKMFVVKRLFVNHRFKVGISMVYLPAVSELVITGPSVPEKLTGVSCLCILINFIKKFSCVYGSSSVFISIADSRVCSGGRTECEGCSDEVDSKRNGTKQERACSKGAQCSERS